MFPFSSPSPIILRTHRRRGFIWGTKLTETYCFKGSGGSEPPPTNQYVVDLQTLVVLGPSSTSDFESPRMENKKGWGTQTERETVERSLSPEVLVHRNETPGWTYPVSLTLQIPVQSVNQV